MKAIASSDWHLSPSTAPFVWATIDQLAKEVTQRETYLVVCGDILEQPRSLDGGLWLELSSRLRAFPCPVVLIPGNHDQLVRGDWATSPLLALSGRNIHVVGRPEWHAHLGLLVPYTDPANWAEYVVDALTTGEEAQSAPRVTWAHQGFKGAYQNLMRRDADGIDVPRGMRTTITGHYHMPQNLGPLIYCGSPYQTSHAETGQTKSYLVFDDLKPSVDMPLPRRVAFEPIGPRYWTLVWANPNEDPPALPAEWREGDVVRVVAAMAKDDLRSRGKQLSKAGLKTASLVAKPPAREAIGRGILSDNSSAVDAATDWLIAVHGPDPTTPDPHDVMDFAREHDLWPA